MKGPGLKNKLEVRRLWKCPETGKTLFEDGHVTSRQSPFTKDLVWMNLIEEKRPERKMVLVEDFSVTEFIEPEGAPPPKKAAPKPNFSKLSDMVITEEPKEAESNFGEGLEEKSSGSDDSKKPKTGNAKESNSQKQTSEKSDKKPNKRKRGGKRRRR